MPLLQIVCDNCGVKYRLPETFTGSSAKCKQCGSSIDVAAQRNSAAQPVAAAARPASARPASPRSAPKASGSPRTATRQPSEARAPREPQEAPAKSNKPLIFGGIGAAAAVVVVAVLMMGGGDKEPKKSAKLPVAEASAKPAESKPTPVAAVAKKKPGADDGPSSPLAAAAKPGSPGAKAPAPQDKGNPKASPVNAPAAKPASAPASAPASGGKPVKDALAEEREKLVLKDLDAWQKIAIKSLDQVLDVQKATKPLAYPDEITVVQQKALADLFTEAKDGGGGARTGRALRKMEAMGFPALFFLINTLREINYRDYDSLVMANQLNMTLSNLTLGINTGFVPVEAGPDSGKLDPRIAQWDALTVERWIAGALAQWPTKAKFDEYIVKRRAKKDAELDDGDATDAGKK